MAIPIRLALDWTPNTIHTGFYVASALGSYKRAGLAVEFVLPDGDGHTFTPASRLTQGGADLAIASSETVIDQQVQGIPLVGIAAVLARDASAIVTRKDRRIDRPQQLDGKVYASYGGRFEEAFVRQMVANDGGRGQLHIRKPAKLNVWNALLTNETDAAWIYLPWEGMDAQQRDIELNSFPLGEYEVPYGYSPLLITHQTYLSANTDPLRAFVKATAEGYRFAITQPDEAARLLIATARHPTLANADFVEQSQHAVADYYLNQAGQWGVMRREVWNAFAHWLLRHDYLVDKEGEKVRQIDIDLFFTNTLFG